MATAIIRAGTIKFGKHKFKIEIWGQSYDYIIFEIKQKNLQKLLKAGILHSSESFKIKKKRDHFIGHASSIKYEFFKDATKQASVHLQFVPCS